MNEYYDLPKLIDPALIQRSSQFGSAELADGMKGLGIPQNGCLDASILPIDEHTKMVGAAYTVDTKDGDNFPIHVAIYSGKPGYVLMVDGKGYQDTAYMGDLMGGAAKAVGLEGIVIDGYVRDRLGLKGMNLPVYSRGYMQRGPKKVGPGRINAAIQCAGVTVNPGDLVLGDADGVTVVPRDRLEEVLDRAEEKNNYEINRRKVIAEYEECKAAGRTPPELAPKWVTDMLAAK